ncbi:hypothetical protein A0U91_14990 (plasmid) [Acetobacter persici]|uniref:Uncharacterized protein n=2 Tax=Acetobacter persici TaxID=1076596 RepID=A0A1U9LIU8_9PROT|nr:hypothetical protein A0U91_14990 [Acetobacter persici]
MIENLAGTVNTVAVTTSNQRTVAQAAAPLIRGSARFSDVYDQFHSQPSPARPASTEGRPEQDGQEGNDRESTGALVDGTSTAEGGMATASASDGSDAKLGQKQSDHRVRDAQSASSSSKYGRSDQNPAVESDTASTDITSPLLTAQAPAKGDVDADATEKDRGDQKADDGDVNEIASSVIQTFIGSLFIGAPSLSGPQNIGPADQKAGVAHSASIDGKAAQDTLLRDLSGGTVEQPLAAANASGLATPLVDSQSGLPLVDPPSLNAGMGTQVGLADASANPALASPAVTSTASVSSVVSDVSGNAEAPSYGGALAPSVTVNAALTGLDVNVVSGISVKPASGTDRISTTDPSNDDRGNIDLNTYLSQNWVSGQGVNSQTDKLSGMSQAQTTAVVPATFPQVQKSAGKEGVGVSSVNGAADKKLESPDAFSPLGIAASEQMAQQTQDQSEEQSSGNSDHRASEPSRPAATEDGMPPSQSLSFEQQVAQSSQNIGYQDTGAASTKNGAGKSPKADAPYAASNANPVSRLSVRSEGEGAMGAH